MIAVSSSSRSMASAIGSPPSRVPSAGPIGPQGMIRVPALAAPLVALVDEVRPDEGDPAPLSEKK